MRFLILAFLFLLKDPSYVQTAGAELVICRTGSFTQERFALLVNEKLVLEDFHTWTEYRLLLPEGSVKLKTTGNRYLTSNRDYLLELQRGETYYLEAFTEYSFLVSSLQLQVTTSKEFEGFRKRIQKEIVIDLRSYQN